MNTMRAGVINLRRNLILRLCVAGLMLAGSVSASTIIADFETGSAPGWTITGNAWQVVGSAAWISAYGGSYSAFSGAPNTQSGNLAESDTGIALSPALTVTNDTLSWAMVGWSGPTYNGLNSFEILNSSMQVMTAVGAPESDSWTTASVNLLAVGLTAHETFYFRAVDGNSASAYAWIAFDNVTLTGSSVAPEPGSAALLLSGMAAVIYSWRRRNARR